LAAGVHAPPTLVKGFATTQAAWRFYGNPRVKLPELCAPLIEQACSASSECCDNWVLAITDWSNLRYNRHPSKPDRVALSMNNDLGYELLTCLAVSDRDGSPMAPLCLELRAGKGLYTTRSAPSRSAAVQKPLSQLDRLEPVMDQVMAMPLGRPVVFIIDREADSVAHYRRWDAASKKFIVRADEQRKVLHEGKEQTLRQVADGAKRSMKPSRPVLFKATPAQQFVAETTIVLNRPAHQNRVDPHSRKKRHKVIVGPELPLRLIIAQVRDSHGKVLARWLLLSNLPSTVDRNTIALWYYWRWKIESYHKLLKSAGQQVQEWQQETAAALVRRLLVTAMSVVLVWQIARDQTPDGQALRATLIKLSGRQMKRTKNSRGFTEPALLAGLCVLMPMLMLLETMSLSDLKQAAAELKPLIQAATRARRSESG
jgi:hypothetical protein